MSAEKQTKVIRLLTTARHDLAEQVLIAVFGENKKPTDADCNNLIKMSKSDTAIGSLSEAIDLIAADDAPANSEQKSDPIIGWKWEVIPGSDADKRKGPREGVYWFNPADFGIDVQSEQSRANYKWTALRGCELPPTPAPDIIQEEREELEQPSPSEPPYKCVYCGAPSWVDPSDQSPPPDYCHEGDHGSPELCAEPDEAPEMITVPILGPTFDAKRVLGSLTIEKSALPTDPRFVFSIGLKTMGECETKPGDVPKSQYKGPYELICVSPISDENYLGYLRQVGMVDDAERETDGSGA